MWVDVTWGAGGSTADKTMELCINALKYHGLDVMMHLTCTNMEKEKLLEALQECKHNGIRNILALRGDPPAGVNTGESTQGPTSSSPSCSTTTRSSSPTWTRAGRWASLSPSSPGSCRSSPMAASRG